MTTIPVQREAIVLVFALGEVGFFFLAHAYQFRFTHVLHACP